MGLSATQARFLSCTARKSNVEYQGQQINEQRTVLANQSSSTYNQMLTLKVPTPPSQANFVKVSYQCTIDGVTYDISEADINKITSASAYNTDLDKIAGTKSDYYFDKNAASGDITVSHTDTEGKVTTKALYGAIRKNTTDSSNFPNSYDASTSRLSQLYLGTTKFTGADAATADTNYAANNIKMTPNETSDTEAYNDAYNQYKYDQYLYEQKLDEINAKTVTIQTQDKTLELQLKELDTEHSALKTELESLKKVIDDNVQSSYKTFGG